MKKAFLRAKLGYEGGDSWVEVMTREEVREYLSKSLEEAGVKGGDFERLVVIRCPGNGKDAVFSGWGDAPMGAPEIEEVVGHEGLRVEIDDVVVYNTIRPDEDEDPDDHNHCELCA